MRASFKTLGIVLGLGSTLLCAPAYAWKKDFRSIQITSAYGVAGGIGAGLLTWPFSSSYTSVLYGVGVGFFLGVAAGVYHINYRYDPENPLRQNPDVRVPWGDEEASWSTPSRSPYFNIVAMQRRQFLLGKVPLHIEFKF